MIKPVIEIFYAFDDNFLKYAAVSMISLMENASKNYDYNIHILNGGLCDRSKEQIKSMAKPGFTFSFEDVSFERLLFEDHILPAFYSRYAPGAG